MAIANAVQRGPTVYVYDTNGRVLTMMPADPGGLHGFTGSTVSVRRGNTIYTYNERGIVISVAPAR